MWTATDHLPWLLASMYESSYLPMQVRRFKRLSCSFPGPPPSASSTFGSYFVFVIFFCTHVQSFSSGIISPSDDFCDGSDSCFFCHLNVLLIVKSIVIFSLLFVVCLLYSWLVGWVLGLCWGTETTLKADVLCPFQTASDILLQWLVELVAFSLFDFVMWLCDQINIVLGDAMEPD
jgi:hypothetical protein